MFIVSVIFLWTFSAEEYLELSTSLPRTRSLGGAVLEVLDVRDIFEGLWYMCKILLCRSGRSRTVVKDLGGRESDLDQDTMEMI